MREVKLISDGTMLGTKLIDVKSGEMFGYIKTIRVDIDVNKPLVSVTAEFFKVPLEIVAGELKVVS